jgi:hypothetical protein
MQIPRPIQAFWRGWRALATKLGHFNGLVLLTILYWFLIGIVGSIFRLFRQDPLGARLRHGSTYHRKDLKPGPVSEYEHLY